MPATTLDEAYDALNLVPIGAESLVHVQPSIQIGDESTTASVARLRAQALFAILRAQIQGKPQ